MAVVDVVVDDDVVVVVDDDDVVIDVVVADDDVVVVVVWPRFLFVNVLAFTTAMGSFYGFISFAILQLTLKQNTMHILTQQ